VVAVAPSGPAEQAGLKPSSDVIVAIDGRPIATPEALAEAISQHAPGDAVKLLVFSAGQFHDLPVVLRAAL
jgi:serine protease Do